jgi:hypothetical protein
MNKSNVNYKEALQIIFNKFERKRYWNAKALAKVMSGKVNTMQASYILRRFWDVGVLNVVSQRNNGVKTYKIHEEFFSYAKIDVDKDGNIVISRRIENDLDDANVQITESDSKKLEEKDVRYK